MAPLSVNGAGSAQKVPSTPQIFTSDTTQPSSDPSVPHYIHYLEEGVQEDANYRVQWSNWMSDGQKKSCYKHVFALLLSWHPECDDMAVEEEVRRLRGVLEDTYNYEVESVLIDSRQNALPQVQANQAVANFVAQNDKDDTLFIVYYAGHGSPGKVRGDLNMSARRRQEKLRLEQQFSHITWNVVEGNLKTTRADVLLIFDCCYASDLGRESVLSSRSFEYLAASNTTYTRSPGEASFTSALIWALERLAVQSSRASPQASPMFTTTKLAGMICEAPGFPPDQQPSLKSRDFDGYQHIILAPLPREGISSPASPLNIEDQDGIENEEEDEDYKPVPQFLSLTFHFKTMQDETALKKLADHLKSFMRLENTTLHKVMWSGIWGGRTVHPRHRFREAVIRVMAHAQSPVSRPNNLFSPSTSNENDMPSPQNSYQSNDQTPLLSDTSSSTLEDEVTTQTIRSRIKSFFQSLVKPRLMEREVRNGRPRSIIGKKSSKKWISCFMERLRKWFKQPSPRVQLAA